MKTSRILFIAIVSIIAVALILFSLNNKGYEKVGRVNEYVLYYDQSIDDGSKYGGYIIKLGFYEEPLSDALETTVFTREYLDMFDALILEYETDNND